jgi:thioredoxin
VKLIEITSNNFESTIQRSPLVVLDFWASWCPPCQVFGPIFEAAAEQHADVTFGKVNTEEQTELASAFAVRAIPTVMAFKQGVLVFSQPGLLLKSALDKLIEKLRALEMEAVNKETASEVKGLQKEERE